MDLGLSLPTLLSFLENAEKRAFPHRYVFELPMAKTKILKKGQQVQCMSTGIMKITNMVDRFKSKLQAELHQD